jgi:hypothetical protein
MNQEVYKMISGEENKKIFFRTEIQNFFEKISYKQFNTSESKQGGLRCVLLQSSLKLNSTGC